MAPWDTRNGLKILWEHCKQNTGFLCSGTSLETKTPWRHFSHQSGKTPALL